MAEIKNERLFEMVNPSSKSDIDISRGNMSSDLGLSNTWAIQKLFADFILVEYIDISEGYQIDEETGLYMVQKEHAACSFNNACFFAFR